MGMNNRQQEWILLTAVLILAAVLRFGWVGVNSFSFDEARVSQLALQMAREGDFAELGMQSSTGVPNFPAAVWLFALPYRLSTNPQLATHFAALISFLGTIGIWWLARVSWGRWAGLSAAALYAAFPFVVAYSRNIWSQNLLAPFAIFWAITAIIGVSRWADEQNYPPWLSAVALAAHAFLAGFIVQIHIAGISLVLASVWLGLRYRLWNRWLPIVIGTALALLAAAPTIYTIVIYGSGAQAELADILNTPSATDWRGFSQLVELGLNLRWERLWLNESWQWSQPLAFLLWLPFLLTTAGLVIGSLMAIRKIIGGWHFEQVQPTAAHVLLNLLPVWAISAPLFFLRSKTPVAIHYQLSSLPALILLMIFCITLFPKSTQKYMAGSAAVIALIWATAVGQALSIISTELVSGGMGTPLLYPQQAVQTLQSDQRPLVIHSFGDAIEFDGDAAVFNVLLWDKPHQIVDGRSVLLIPDQPAHLLSTFDDIPAWVMANELGILEQGHIQPLPRRLNEPPYMGITLNGVELQPLFDEVPPYTLANGAVLNGWRLEQLPDGRLRLITYWYITQETEQHFQQFNHLYLEGSTMPDQVRDVPLSSRSWQADNHLITWVEFDPSPAPPTRFDIGMYTWPDLQRSPVLGREGDPLAPIQLFPPVLE